MPADDLAAAFDRVVEALATEPAAKISREFLRLTTAGDVKGAHETLNVGLQEVLPPEKLGRMIEELPDRFRVKNVESDITFDHREVTKEMNIVVVLLMGKLVNDKGETRYCMFKAMQAAPGTWRIYAFNIAKEPISLEEVKKKG